MSVEGKAVVRAIHDTVEAFLDEHPDMRFEPHMDFGKLEQGEGETVLMRRITVGGEEFLVVAKRVGG